MHRNISDPTQEDAVRVNHTKVAVIFPESYEGEVKKPGNWSREVSIIDAATMLEMPPILKRIGDWAITTQGIHSLIMDYEIEKERFDEIDWIEHLAKKDWVKQSDFTSILKMAKDMFRLGII